MDAHHKTITALESFSCGDYIPVEGASAASG